MPTKWYERIEGDRPGRRWRLPPGCLVGVILLLLAFGTLWWLPVLARVLVVDQPPVSASAILILGGGDGSREDRALALYERGLAPMIITSGEKPHLPDQKLTFAELSADYLFARGVAPDAVILMNGTTSTRDEALESLQLARDRGFDSLLIVTDAFHTGRARLTFRKVFRSTRIGLTFVAAYPDGYSMDSWWKSERSLLAVFEEYEKLIFYLLNGYIL